MPLNHQGRLFLTCYVKALEKNQGALSEYEEYISSNRKRFLYIPSVLRW